MENNLFESLHELIARGKEKDALDTLSKALEEKSQQIQHLTEAQKVIDEYSSKDIIAFQYRLNTLNESFHKGIINDENYNLEKNRINNSFLILINEVKSPYQKLSNIVEAINKNNNKSPTIIEHIESNGKYKVLDCKVEGTNMYNFLAIKQDSSKKKVLVKVMKTHHYSQHIDTKFIEDVKFEINKLNYINHDRLINIIDQYLEAAPIFIVVDYINGETIDEKITKINSIPFLLTLEVLIELCGVLIELQKNGIYRTNVRPDKIILNYEFKPFILPFEVIKAGSSKRGFDNFIKDCYYLSPELIGKNVSMLETEPDELDEAIPNVQFSLGLLAYEMLTGIPLFAPEGVNLDRKSIFDLPVPEIFRNRESFFTHRNVREEKWNRLNNLDLGNNAKSFIEIMKKLLQENEKNRYSKLIDLQRDLEKLKPSLTLYGEKLDNSYQRCISNNPAFFSNFYDSLFNALPDIEDKHFKNTDREAQNNKLSVALKSFFASGEKESFIKHIPKIEKHKSISFEQYSIFINTLIKTIEKSDPLWSEVKDSWEQSKEKTLCALKTVLNDSTVPSDTQCEHGAYSSTSL